MARIICKCGNVLSTTEVPNDVELHVFSDGEWTKIIEQGTIDTVSLPNPEFEVWRCSNCQRLYFFNGNKIEKIYKIEE